MSGYIKVYRKITDNPLWDDKPYSRGQAWLDLLLRVNHKKGKFLIDNEWVSVEPGDSVWSVKDMSSRWGWSRGKVSRFLDVLQSERMVKQERTSKYTKITVVGWEKYQRDGHQTDIKRTSNGHQTDTNNNVKNVKNVNNISNDILGATPTYGKPEINQLVDYWQEHTGVKISSAKQANRNACNNLLKKYGEDGVQKLIRTVSAAQADRYAPRIADFTELQSKLNKLLVWSKTQQIDDINTKGIKL